MKALALKEEGAGGSLARAASAWHVLRIPYRSIICRDLHCTAT